MAPQILSYTDYRLLLRDFYHYKKSLKSGFSFRQFAARCGMKSPNYIQLVILGQRNLSNEAAPKVAQALGLRLYEKKYFIALVEFDNAGGTQSESEKRKQILQARSKLVMRQIPADHRAVLNNPHCLVIRELCSLRDFEYSPSWVCNKLAYSISEDTAAQCLSLLSASGHIQQDKTGRWQMSEPHIDTGHNFDEFQVLKFHIETLKVWCQILPNLSKDSRELGVLNIPINSQKIPEFKNRIRNFQDEIIGWLEAEDNPDTLVQLGTYLVPLSKNSVESET
jgi:uncharacterized protein (TIGR02147 family)